MQYTTLISNLRSQVGDTKRPKYVTFPAADGSTNTFQLPADSFPVYDGAGTYVVKVDASTKTETTDFVLDKAAGVITMVVTPTAGQVVSISHKAVHLQDADWLYIINATIRSLGDDFWKEFLDSTTWTTTINMLSLSLVASQPLCIAIYELSYRKNTGEDWKKVEDFTNWRFDRENNIIYFGNRDAFNATGDLLRVRGLKTYTIGDTVSSTLDVQDKFLTILEYGSISRYWQWRYKDVVELVSKQTQESSRTPLQELMMLSDRFTRQYETEKAKLKPMKPPRIVPQILNNGGVA